MKYILVPASLGSLCLLLAGCGDASPSNPTPITQTTATTTAPQVARFEIQTLVTVYTRNDEFAQWTQATTTDERIGLLLVDAEAFVPGTTVYNNEERRVLLQNAIDRIVEEFEDGDYVSAFGETKENLERFFNDSDNDGWSIDGRFGVGRDWPFDSDGNDPDGWTAQIIVIVNEL